MDPDRTSPPSPAQVDKIIHEAPTSPAVDAITPAAALNNHLGQEDQVSSLPCVEIVLDGSDLLGAAASGNDGLEISIKFEKEEEGQEEEGPQAEFVNQLDGVEVKVYLDGTQTVDVEVIPPGNADTGEGEQILAGLDTSEGRLEELLDTEERSELATPHIESNVPELTSAIVDVEDEAEKSSSKEGERKRTREEEDVIRNMKSKLDQNIDEIGGVAMEAEESKENDGEKIVQEISVKHVDANYLQMGDENRVKPVTEVEVKKSDQFKEGACDDGNVETNHDGKKSNKLGLRKRRKIAMLLAYCGAGYQGMQKNPGAVTIEGELEKALVKADAMPLNFDGNPRKVDWMRAARTDKGVSAVGQIVSGLFYIDPPGFVERVNNHLPEEIRVLGFKRVIPSFSAKQLCDRRRYEYVIPIFALDPTTHTDRENVVLKEGSEEAYSKCLKHCGTGNYVLQNFAKECETSGTEQLGDSTASCVNVSKDVIETVSISEETKTNETRVFSSEEQVSSRIMGEDVVQIQTTLGIESTNSLVVGDRVNSFRFGEPEKTKLNRILNKFVGTHNFHNFTSRIKGEDPSAKRYITSFEAGNVFTVSGMEFIRCTVVGQSFVLHQIRKMVGLSIAVFRGCAPESMIDLSLRRDMDFTIPTAPELGLFLDECMYPAYNKRWYDTHEEISQKGYEKEISCFKETIYKHIAETERKEGQMALFLHSLNDRNYADFATARDAGKP